MPNIHLDQRQTDSPITEYILLLYSYEKEREAKETGLHVSANFVKVAAERVSCEF
jgi:hypothetical protein